MKATVDLNVGNEVAPSRDRAGRVRRVKVYNETTGAVREEPLSAVHEKIVERRLLESSMADAVKCVGCKGRLGYPRTKKGKIGRGPRYCDECAVEYARVVRREIGRKWAEANPQKVRDKARRWAEANPETRRKWIEANRKKVREKDRQWAEANREKVREWDRKRYEANREKINERQRKRRGTAKAKKGKS